MRKKTPARAQRGRPPARSAVTFSPEHLLTQLKRSGLSVAALEKSVLDQSGVHATVADYLGGTRPSGEVIHALARALDCSMEDFFIERGI